MTAELEGKQLHEQLHKLLSTADGETSRIVATFVDIRGFSAFASKGDSFDTAAYLRSIFTSILDSHFDDACFFKPTGDGLLLIHDLPSDSYGMQTVVSSVLRRCVVLVSDFAHLTDNDTAINFPTPDLLGIGVARGAVTRLVNGGLVLDYTGRYLNLAARLMDKARPYGVVFADDRASQLMETDVAELFTSDRVCIRGISDDKAIDIFISKGVEITPADREPVPHSMITYGPTSIQTVDEVRDLPNYGFSMPRPPYTFEARGVHVAYPSFDSTGKETGAEDSLTVYGEVEDHPGGVFIRIQMKRVHEALSGIPSATRFLGFNPKVKVTFTPFYEPEEH